jgi:hypothetical protein
VAGTGILGRFLGNTVAEGAAFAAGVAIGPVLGPPVQELRNTVNAKYPFVYPDPGMLAAGVAQGQVDPGEAAKWASYHGIGGAAFEALVAIADTGPGSAAAFNLWRRGEIDDAGFRRALKRAAIEDEWVDALVKTKYQLLDPAAIANAVQQGHLPDPGILPEPTDGALPLDIPLTQIDLDPVALAAGQGIDLDTLKVMANLSGLPPPQGELREMLNRGIITEDAFTAGIREGHTKTKWIGAVHALARRILTPTEYVNAHIKGWIDEGAMHTGAALSGLNAADTDLLFKVHGSPLSWHQVWIGLARGGVYDGPTSEIDPAMLKGMQESNLRPEWYNLANAQRYSYPAPFVLRTLTQSGDLTAEEADQILRFVGWEPTLATKVSKRWAAGSSSASKEATASDLVTLYQGYKITRPELVSQLEQAGYQADQAELKAEVADAARVKSARDTAITGLHRAYIKGTLDEARATAALTKLELDTQAVPAIVSVWTIERDA